MGQVLFADKDPAAKHFAGRSHVVRRDGDTYTLHLPLPLATKEEVGLLRTGEELVVRIGSVRRNIVLPYVLAQQDVAGARFEDDTLVIAFDGKR